MARDTQAVLPTGQHALAPTARGVAFQRQNTGDPPLLGATSRETWPGEWIHSQDRAWHGLMLKLSGDTLGASGPPVTLPTAVPTSHTWLLPILFQLIKINFQFLGHTGHISTAQ